MLTGSLRNNGNSFGERQVDETLQSITSVASSQRKVKAGRSFNPRVYSAEYFGHKIYYDENEKLGMYGAVHVCARNGYSGMIVGFATMPIKNCLTTHDQIYLQILFLLVHFCYTHSFYALVQWFRHLKISRHLRFLCYLT